MVRTGEERPEDDPIVDSPHAKRSESPTGDVVYAFNGFEEKLGWGKATFTK